MAAIASTVDIDREFRDQLGLVVNVQCRRLWLLRLRFQVFGWAVRVMGWCVGLRVLEIVAEGE